MNCFHKCVAIAAMALVGILPASGGTQGDYPSFSGSKKMAIIMLSWSDRACPGTRQNVVDRMWNDPKSARNYYLDLSRGAFDFALPADANADDEVLATTTSVYGPYELSIAAGFDKDVTFANSSNLYRYNAKGAEGPARILAAADGYDAADYDYIMYVTPKTSDTGGLRGYAYFNSNYSHNFEVKNRTINHELGHNLGMHHSNMGFGNGYGSYDCIMANNLVPHLDGPHTYQMGWYPDDCWSMKTYGQYDIENLAQPDTDNLKLLRFDRSAHGATTKSDQNFWIEYRKRGVGQDSDLNSSWDRSVTVHQTTPSSRRPGDSFNYHLTNQIANFQAKGSYTGTENTCVIRFVRENASNASATVQLVDPNGNQPPSVLAGENHILGLGTESFMVNASDPENDTLTYTIVTQPSSGTLNNNGNNFTYTASTLGTYPFTVRVNDSQYDSFDTTISLTVVGASPPTVNAGIDQTVVLIIGNAWTPATMSSSAWYDASDANTMSHDSGTFSQWNDKSGNGIHLKQLSASNQPSTGLDYFNDLNVVTFKGVSGSADHYLQADLGIPTAAQFFSVAQYTDLESNRPTMVGDKSQNSHFIQFNSDEAGNFNGSSAYFNGESTTGAANQLANLSLVRINKTISNSILSLGRDRGINNRSFDGYIAEILIFDTALSTTDQQLVEGYLAHKWGLDGNLPSSHPHKAIIPGGDNVVVTLDGTVGDVDGDALTSTWSKVSGPGQVTFVNSASEDTVATLVSVGVYVLRLTTTDGSNQVYDDVSITVSAGSGPVVSVIATDAAAAEAGQDPGTWTISRTGNTVAALDVDIGMSGSATVTSDYVLIASPVTIPAGQSSIVVTLTPVDDNDTEGGEVATLTVGANANYIIGNASADINIIDDESVSYSNWISNYNVGGLTELNDDADNDGVPNGLESFFGTDPTQTSRGVEASGLNTNVFTFTHPESATPAADLISAYQWSKSLSQFNLGGVTVDGAQVDFTVQRDTPSAGITTVTATLTGSSVERLFFNIMVTQQ